MTLRLTPGLLSAFLALAALSGGGAVHAQSTISIYNFELTSNGSSASSTTLYSGQGALGAGGNIFNNANQGQPNFTSAAAVDSYGAQSAVTLSVANSLFSYSQAPGSSYTATDPAQLFTQYDGGNQVTEFSLANLTADTPYTLYLYGSDNYGEGSTFTVSNGSAVNPLGGTATSTAAGGSSNITAFAYGSNYVVFSGETDASGDISGTYAGNAGYGPLNGLQVELTPSAAAAPEPSQIAMLALVGLGLGGLLLRARRNHVS